MARPQPQVLFARLEDLTQWQVLRARALYVITYQGKPFGLRALHPMVNGEYKKYYKTSYTNRGSARAAVRTLNERFQTEDFAYTAIGDDDEI
jgi:hypothetical protein